MTTRKTSNEPRYGIIATGFITDLITSSIKMILNMNGPAWTKVMTGFFYAQYLNHLAYFGGECTSSLCKGHSFILFVCEIDRTSQRDG